MAFAACGRPAPRHEPDGEAGLAEVLFAAQTRVRAAVDPEAAARAIVAGWRLPRREFAARLIPAAAPLWAEYAAAFDAAAPALAARLHAWALDGAEPDVRRHDAGDPEVPRAASRLRALAPTGRPGSVVVPADGDVILGEVFVHDGSRWRTLTGLDEAIAARVAGGGAACARAYARAGALDRCGDLGWELTRAALSGDAAALTRACTHAVDHCR